MTQSLVLLSPQASSGPLPVHGDPEPIIVSGLQFDDTYWHHDALVVFSVRGATSQHFLETDYPCPQVDGTLFRIHPHVLEKHSAIIRNLIGAADNNGPVTIDNINAGQFRILLDFFSDG
jgi:hypothetical protein